MKHKVVFTGEIYKYLRGPIVYIWKREETYLYIGQTSQGLYRLFDKAHHAIEREEPKDNDSFEVIICNSALEAKELERKMIFTFKPLYNEILFDNGSQTRILLTKNCKRCGKEFTTHRINKRFCRRRCQYKRMKPNKIQKALEILGFSDISDIEKLKH